MLHTRLVAAILLLVPACSGDASPSAASAPSGPKYQPMMKAELVPPVLAGLVLGAATEAEVTAAFGAGEVLADKSIGGGGKVQYNDAAAKRVTLTGKGDVMKGEAWFVPDAKGAPRLVRLEVTTKPTQACKWIETNVGSLEGAKRRPGSNRKFGPDGNGVSLTAGTADGSAPVGIECHGVDRDGTAVESIEYSIESEQGRSMSASPGE